MSDFILTVSLFVFALAIGLYTIHSLGKIAHRVGLVDVPNGERKFHENTTPVVGGLGIFISLACAMAVFDLSMPHLLTLGAVVMMVGALDDICEISAKHRFAAQVAVCGMLAVTSEYQITYLGDLLGLGSIAFQHEFTMFAFTLICFVGIVNSANMMDGIDGLCAGVCALSFAAVGLFAWQSEMFLVAGFCVAVTGSVAGFLLLNMGALGAARKVFLGDAGSMLLGLLLAAVLVKVTQAEGSQLRTVTAGWIVALPIIDTVVVMVRRLAHGGHPFRAGTDHIHHKLLNRGWSARQVLVALLLAQATLISLGFLGEYFEVPEAFMFWAFVSLVLLHFACTWTSAPVVMGGKETRTTRFIS